MRESRRKGSSGGDSGSPGRPSLLPKPLLFGEIDKSEIESSAFGSTSQEESVAHLEKLSDEAQKHPWYGSHFKKMQAADRSGALTIHWTHLMYFLETLCRRPDETGRNTPGLESKKIDVPEEIVAYMAGVPKGIVERRDNIYYHNGCRVHALGVDMNKGSHRKLILTGSKAQIASVEEYISETQERLTAGDPFLSMRKPLVSIYHRPSPAPEERGKAPVIRGVWAVSLREEPTPPIEHGDGISIAAVSDTKELTELVEDLIETQNYRVNVKRKEYHAKPVAPFHYQVVDSTLRGLFRLEQNRPFMSTGAVNMALTFFCEHGLLYSARDVLVRAQHLVTADSFATLLRSAAKNEDPAMFHDTLIAMAKQHVRPNRRTWAAFTLFFGPTEEKEYVLRYVMSEGLSNHKESEGPFTLTKIADSFSAHLKNGQTVDTFMEALLKTELETTITSILLFEIACVLVALKDFAALGRLVDIIVERLLPLDTSIPVRALSAMDGKDVFTAVELLFRCMRHPTFRMNSHVYRELYHVARKGECYNLCRVAYRYACMSGMVDLNLKRLVQSSLVSHIPFRPDEDGGFFRAVGKVALGVDMYEKYFQLPDSIREYMPPEYHEFPVAYFISGRPQLSALQWGKKKRMEQFETDTRWRFAHDLVRRDIHVGPKYFAVNSLPLMLDAAALIDQEWKGQPRPIRWLIQNAIRVPIARER